MQSPISPRLFHLKEQLESAEKKLNRTEKTNNDTESAWATRNIVSASAALGQLVDKRKKSVTTIKKQDINQSLGIKFAETKTKLDIANAEKRQALIALEEVVEKSTQNMLNLRQQLHIAESKLRLSEYNNRSSVPVSSTEFIIDSPSKRMSDMRGINHMPSSNKFQSTAQKYFSKGNYNARLNPSPASSRKQNMETVRNIIINHTLHLCCIS